MTKRELQRGRGQGGRSQHFSPRMRVYLAERDVRRTERLMAAPEGRYRHMDAKPYSSPR